MLPFAAATVHDVFNLISVVVFLPLEILFHPLEKAGLALAGLFAGGGGVELGGFNFLKAVTSPTVDFFKGMAAVLPDPWSGIALILVGIVLILFSITYIGRLLKKHGIDRCGFLPLTGHAEVKVVEGTGSI